MSVSSSRRSSLNRKECHSSHSGFKTKPYSFRLTDLFDKTLIMPAKCIVNKATMSCPPFYVLLDHVVGVLWLIYSSTDLDILSVADIEWTMHFLNALIDYRSQEDINLIISHLQEILIQMYAHKEVQEKETIDDSGNKSNSKLYADLKSFVLCDMIGNNKNLVQKIIQPKNGEQRKSEGHQSIERSIRISDERRSSLNRSIGSLEDLAPAEQKSEQILSVERSSIAQNVEEPSNLESTPK